MDEPKYTDRNLYGQTGHPMPWDVAQLKLGDCYLLAPMASLAFQQPEAIERSIRYDAPTESFAVTLYKSQKAFLGLTSTPKAVNVTVSQADIDQEIKESSASRFDRGTGSIEATWPAVVETAYAKLSMKDGETLLDGFRHIGNGGWPRDAVYALTGEKAESVSDHSLRRGTLDQAHGRIETALKESRPIILTTRAVPGQPNDGLVTSDNGAGHAYTIESVTKDKSGNVTIKARNPWGTTWTLSMASPAKALRSKSTLRPFLRIIIFSRSILVRSKSGPTVSKMLRRIDAPRTNGEPRSIREIRT